MSQPKMGALRRRAQAHSTERSQNPSLNRSVSGVENNAGDEDEDFDGEGRLTLMEEVLLLGLKDREGYTSFWNDCISEGLRGCILVELTLRKRVRLEKNGLKKKSIQYRVIDVCEGNLCGDVLLDEALKHMKSVEEAETCEGWIELLSGETWNPMKLKYQLHNVRERLSKSLVEKGVLTTQKQNFLLFDVITHPVVETSAKAKLIKRVQDTLLKNWKNEIHKMNQRNLSLILLAHISDVLDNALISLNDNDYSIAMRRLYDLLNCEPNDECDRDGAVDILWAVVDVFNNR